VFLAVFAVSMFVSPAYAKGNAGATRTAIVRCHSVNLRKSNSKRARVIVVLPKGDRLTVLADKSGWYRVRRMANGTEGWVYKSLVNVSNTNRGNVTRESTSRQQATNNPGFSSLGKKAVEYGKRFLGVKYVYGANGPKAFDCSGYTSYVYRGVGLSIPRVAADQASRGSSVRRSELKPGDLLFFDTRGRRSYINHVGMYIGDGNFIHASSSSRTRKVVISSLSNDFYSKAFMGARRVAR